MQSEQNESSGSGMESLTPEEVEMIGGGTNTGTRSPPPPPPTTSPITVTANPPPPPPVTSPITVTANPPPPPPVTSPITVTASPPGGSPPSPPPPPPKNPNCANPTQQVDLHFISNNEGGQQTTAYWPGGNSGVTVATGIDLHGRTQASMAALGWPQDLINLVLPYTTQTGSAAQQYLQSHPLTVTTSQANLMDSTVMQGTINGLASSYNNASSFADFFQLPEGAQSAIADVAFQYTNNGTTLGTATPQFWQQVTSGDWQAAYNNLMNFGDAYATRRQADAAKLKDAMDNNNMPTPSNPC